MQNIDHNHIKFKKNNLKTSHCTKDLNVLSLFSGCGGMDLGFEGGFDIHKDSFNSHINNHWNITPKNKNFITLPMTRFKTIFANDIRKGARKVWGDFFSNNYKTSEESFHLESIVDRVKRYWDGDKSVFPTHVDVVTGGFPCQDFSVAGKRKGFNSHKGHHGKILNETIEENRGKLYMWMREVIDITNPKFFIAENVKGLISLGGVKEIIQNDFKNIGEHGYLVLDGRVLLSADYGVPQSRERIFFIGLRKDALKKNAFNELIKDNSSPLYSPFPLKTHGRNNGSKNGLSSGLKNHVFLKKVFTDLKEPDQTSDPDQKAYSKCKWYGKHCQGNSEVKLNKIGPTIRAEHHGNIEFRRLSKEHGGVNFSELDRGLKERRLTIRECCRIQTFPDNFKLIGDKRGKGVSASESYKLIGNAVPPLLAFHLAKRLEDVWNIIFKK